jgi:hypothetical protein
MDVLMINLIRITSPILALKIFKDKAYFQSHPQGHYDAGMNFLGVLGQNSNTQPTKVGAKVYFEWDNSKPNSVSPPLPPSVTSHHTPNVLFDFNGSGEHETNNDPRYFLPYGSSGLILKKIELEAQYDEQKLVKEWCNYKKGLYPYVCKLPFTHKYLWQSFKSHIQEVNDSLNTGIPVTISVIYRK